MLHDILTTADIMARYGCERQTASKIMHKLPMFRVGNRIFVRARDLTEWEESRTEYPISRKAARATETVTIPRRRA